ncbi:hypothetical protein IZU99_02455 [Oscillospiraceae bacterium CM]|nr:hypothetical protein IZU99_02455 [Oscillospiraceae bacterium CM]
MVEVQVNPGVCGLRSEIKVEAAGRKAVKIDFKTACPTLKPLEEELKEADPYKVALSKYGENEIFEMAKKYCKHAACPVPSAIIKGIEAAAGLALPRDVDFKISKV